MKAEDPLLETNGFKDKDKDTSNTCASSSVENTSFGIKICQGHVPQTEQPLHSGSIGKLIVDSGVNGVLLTVNNTSTHCYNAFIHWLVDNYHNQSAVIAHWYG